MKNKQEFLWILLALSVIGLGFMVSGCSSASSSSDTTMAAVTTTTAGGPTTTSAATTTTNPLINSTGQQIGQSASIGAGLLLGVANVGSAVGNMCGISGSPTQSFAVHSYTTIPVPPPDSFFATQEAGWDGTLQVPSLHTGEVVSVKFSTFGGTPINGAIFTNPLPKMIAKINGINWNNLINTTGISALDWATNMPAWVASPQYEIINSMWDYILWSSVLNQVHSIAEGIHAGTPAFAIPTSSIPADMIGSFYATVTRDATAYNYGVNLTTIGTMEYSTSIIPNHEVPVALTGEGTVTLPSGQVITLSNMSLGFQTNLNGGTIPSSGSFYWSFVISGETWSGTTYINSDRTATGEVSKNGSPVGTMYLDAIGGAIVTIEGQTVFITAQQ